MDETKTCSSPEADLPTELLTAEYWPNGSGYTLISGIEYGTCEDFAGCSGAQVQGLLSSSGSQVSNQSIPLRNLDSYPCSGAERALHHASMIKKKINDHAHIALKEKAMTC